MIQTYKVVSGSDGDCSSYTCKQNGCKFDGISEARVYRNLVDNKPYAVVGDGFECYGMVEVEPEKRGAE